LGTSLKVACEYWFELFILLLLLYILPIPLTALHAVVLLWIAPKVGTVAQPEEEGNGFAVWLQLNVMAVGSVEVANLAEHETGLLSLPVHVQVQGPVPDTAEAPPCKHKLAGVDERV
jgi:hypothetical protein